MAYVKSTKEEDSGWRAKNARILGRRWGGRELVVVAEPEVGLRATRGGVESLRGAKVHQLERVLASEDATMQPLFEGAEDGGDEVEKLGVGVPSLSVFFQVTGVPDERLDALATLLGELDVIDAAYVKPPPTNPVELHEDLMLSPPMSLREGGMLPADKVPEVPPTGARTPDFWAHQMDYLGRPTWGINATWAWDRTGGRGSGVRIRDVGSNWNFGHEDLAMIQSNPPPGGTPAGDPNRGTAVVGVLNAVHDGTGMWGICPDASLMPVSYAGISTAQATQIAAAPSIGLMAGDILLIAWAPTGPRGYQIPSEWWPDNYLAIRYATNRGVIVVQAAGNGWEDLDDPYYDQGLSNFPSWWRNPFKRSPLDSGAIMVGAGRPPTYNNWYGPDRSRIQTDPQGTSVWGSNWGALLDAQGYGVHVGTTGYGDLYQGSSQNEWYTNGSGDISRVFNGTSSAAAMVAGALGCVQGIRRAEERAFTPATARWALRSTGSPQQDGPWAPRTERIGNRPDIQAMYWLRT